MKVEATLRVSDLISWAVMLLVTGTIYGTFKMDNFYLRRDVDADRVDIDKLSEVVKNCSDGLLVLKTIADREERDKEKEYRATPPALSPKEQSLESH